MLKNYAITRIPRGCFFQQAGDPPALCQARESLSRSEVSRQVDEERGPIAWSPRSPDVTPLDLFILECIRDLVYQTKVQDQGEMYH